MQTHLRVFGLIPAALLAVRCDSDRHDLPALTAAPVNHRGKRDSAGQGQEPAAGLHGFRGLQ